MMIDRHSPRSIVIESTVHAARKSLTIIIFIAQLVLQ
jgi:hypothetical protein